MKFSNNALKDLNMSAPGSKNGVQLGWQAWTLIGTLPHNLLKLVVYSSHKAGSQGEFSKVRFGSRMSGAADSTVSVG